MEYHKIETLFVRDMEGTKKLIEGVFRNPVVEYLKDNDWIFTEKIDGTNIRVEWDGHKVSFAGRTDKAIIPGDLLDELKQTFSTNEAEQLFEQMFGEKEATLYGEGYGAGIQSGGDYSPTKKFILFDIMVGKTFLQRDIIKEIAKSFSVDVVTEYTFRKLDEAIMFVKMKPKSRIGNGNKIIEGIIGVPCVPITDVYGKRVIVKIKVEDFSL